MGFNFGEYVTRLQSLVSPPGSGGEPPIQNEKAEQEERIDDILQQVTDHLSQLGSQSSAVQAICELADRAQALHVLSEKGKGLAARIKASVSGLLNQVPPQGRLEDAQGSQKERDKLRRARDILLVWGRMAEAANLPIPFDINKLDKRAYLEAADKFALWFQKNREATLKIEHLYLNNLGLTSLPDEIFSLLHLKALFLNYNKLSDLPAGMGSLIHLESLELGENQLSTLPPEIGELVNLKTLTLHDNQLSSLPPMMGALTKLKYLSLEGNQLNFFPVQWVIF